MDDTLIFAYSRAQAIADGVLIDVTKLATEAGFVIPVALTSAAWADAVAVTDEDTGQDETGRLWDLLNVLKYEARRGGQGAMLFFEVLVSRDGNPPCPVVLKAHCGPGDESEPVLTVMLPDED